jgi:hypothetical protein
MVLPSLWTTFLAAISLAFVTSGNNISTPLPHKQPSPNFENRHLEFVHITKTGGSAVEASASKIGVVWGACHMKHKSLHCNNTQNASWTAMFGELNVTNRHFKDGVSRWHVPMQDLTPNPYEGFDTFTVVRNPFDRAVSEYYCPWSGYKGLNRENAETMNMWLQDKMSVKFKNGVSFYPQHKYVFNGTRQQVTHVLLYDRLEKDLPVLMKRYNLPPVNLSSHINTPNGMQRNTVKLTSANLTEVTRRKIIEYSSGDFEMIERFRASAAQAAAQRSILYGR